MLPVCSMELLNRYALDGESSEMARRLGCSGLLATVLRSKGLSDAKDMDSLRSSLQENLEKLDLGLGSTETAVKWAKSVSRSKVLVYGDYDVDGVCSSALAVEMARESGAESVHYYLPHRQKDGYGVHLKIIERAVSSGIQTLIVTDCGSKDVKSIKYAMDRGMTVMVFDHHSVDGDIIELDSFVNPQRGGSSEAKTLCATAVLWTWAFKTGVISTKWLMDRLDLVALSTVGDCVELGALNRALLREGLAVLRNSRRAGIIGLIDRLDLVQEEIDEETLAMKLVPCLNSSGRMDVADLSLSVLLTGDRSSIERLEELNVRRKELSSSIADDIIQKLENYVQHVMYSQDWPLGLLSAIASRLCSKYSLGFALAAPSERGIKGTLRVPEGANAVDILSELDPLLDAWGGHPYAAGFSVSQSKWEQLSCELESRLRSIQVAEKPETVVDYDPSLLTLSSLEDLKEIGPFGQANPFPSFFTARKSTEKLVPLGAGGLHCKIELKGATLIAFNGAQQHLSMEKIEGWIYRPKVNRWRGKKELQFVVEKLVSSCKSL